MGEGCRRGRACAVTGALIEMRTAWELTARALLNSKVAQAGPPGIVPRFPQAEESESTVRLSRLPRRCGLAGATTLRPVAPGSRRFRGRCCRARPRRALTVHIGLGAEQSGEQARNAEIDIQALPMQPEP